MEQRLAPIRRIYPFKSHYLDLGSARLHYLDEGPRDSSATVLMLHGNPTWSFYYRELIRALSPTCRVIAPDHVGCGLSDKPQHYPYRLQQHIDNTRRLIDQLELRNIHLVVHDWGGAIGFGLAVSEPERFQRLIVLNTAAFFGPMPWRIAVCRASVAGALAVRGANAFVRGAILTACKNRDRMTSEVKRGYLLPYDSYANRVAVHRFVQDIPTQPSHPTYGLIESIDARLHRLPDHPMLICWGMKDFCFNETFLNGWIERFPAAQVHRFPNAGHYVLEDASADIGKLVRSFLGT